MEAIIYTVGENLIDPPLPPGTKYRPFNRKTDLKRGTNVFASLHVGRRQGAITDIFTDRQSVDIDGIRTWITDIQYVIIDQAEITKKISIMPLHMQGI